MRISKKTLASSIGSALGLMVLSTAPAMAASSFSDHLWQFVGGSATNVVDFNKGSSKVFEDSQLYVSTDDWLILQAGQKVIVSNGLTVAGAAQVDSLSSVGTISAGGTITGNLTGNVTGNVTGNTSGSSGSTTGNAATATALAADPANCTVSTEFAVGVTAAGVATCEAIADADVPNALTIDTATGAAMNINNDAGANTTTIGGGSTNGTVFIGTGATAKTVTIGTTAGAGTVNLLSGSSGGVNVTGNETVSGTLSATGTPAGDASGTLNADSSISTAAVGVYGVASRGRLALDAGFGSSVAATPSAGLGMYGKVTGENLTGTANFIAGTVGAYGITGTNASKFYKTGLLGVVSSGTTTADAAVMALLDGDSGLTTARAGYGIMTLNSTGGSGFDYGMDLKIQVNADVPSEMRPFKVADIRLSSGTTISSGDTNPATCVKGSIYLNTTDGVLYGCKTADNWTAAD